MITSEPEPDKNLLDRLKWIKENTHKGVNENLAIIELAVFKNINRGLNREIDIGNKTFYLTQLYKYLDEVTSELNQIVLGIGLKYSVDFPVSMFGKSGNQNISM